MSRARRVPARTMAPRSAARSRSTKTPGTSKKQYRQINRVRYDDSALAIADDADKISLPVAKSIYEDVQDGGVVTATEWATVRYIADGGKNGTQYTLTAPARKYLLDLIPDEDEEDEEDDEEEVDIESEEEDLPATVRKPPRGSGGTTNKRVSFGTARDDVSVGPPAQTNVNVTARRGGQSKAASSHGGGILSPKIAKHPPGYEWMNDSDDEETEPVPNTALKQHRVSFANARTPGMPEGGEAQAPGTAHTWLRRKTLDEVDDPLGAAARDASPSGGTKSTHYDTRGDASTLGMSDPADDYDSETDSDDVPFVPNSVGGRMRSRVKSGGFTVFNVTMPQLTDRVPYSTAAIYVAVAYISALIVKTSMGFAGVKWGGLLWGLGSVSEGHTLSNDGIDWSLMDKEWTKLEVAMSTLAKQVAKATG